MPKKYNWKHGPSRRHIIVLRRDIMNLKNGQITVGEILRNPQARALVQREVPQLSGMLSSPLARGYWNMPLSAVVSKARGLLPANRIQALLAGLEKI